MNKIANDNLRIYKIQRDQKKKPHESRIAQVMLCVAHTFRTFREHAGEALYADLQLHVPDTQHLVLAEADELTTRLVELHLNHRRHVATQYLHIYT